MAISAQVRTGKGAGKVKRFGPPQIAAFVFQAIMATILFGFDPAGRLVAVWWGIIAGSFTLLAFGFEQAFGSGEDESYLTWANAIGGIGIGIPIVFSILVLAIIRVVTTFDVSAGQDESQALIFWCGVSGGCGATFLIAAIRRIFPWNYFLTSLIGVMGCVVGFGLGKLLAGI